MRYKSLKISPPFQRALTEAALCPAEVMILSSSLPPVSECVDCVGGQWCLHALLGGSAGLFRGGSEDPSRRLPAQIAVPARGLHLPAAAGHPGERGQPGVPAGPV